MGFQNINQFTDSRRTARKNPSMCKWLTDEWPRCLIAKRASDVLTQTKKLQDSDKQTGKADDCLLQTRKPSLFQNRVCETTTLPTFLLFLSDHAYVVWTSLGSSNLHSIFRLRALRYYRYPIRKSCNCTDVTGYLRNHVSITYYPTNRSGPHSDQTQKSNATSGFRRVELRKGLKRKPARLL